MIYWTYAVIAILFVVGSAILVYWNQSYPELRASLALGKDLFIGFFSILGIFLAVENLRRSALTARTSVALRLVERWNLMNWEKWHGLRSILLSTPSEAVTSAIRNEHEDTVAAPLNFMEEIAAAINGKSADDLQIWLSVGPTMIEYHDILAPWIADYRTSNRHAWVELEKLIIRWKRSPPR
jgi:hypothetical protein